MFCTARHIL